MALDPASSHRSWFGRSRDRVEVDGIDVFIGACDAVLAFPRSEAGLAAAVDVALEAQVGEVSCWALVPDAALGGRLHGLGFQDGWAPHWMGIDPREAEPPADSLVEETTECTDAVPYASREHRGVLGGEVRHFVVRDEGVIVGHAVLDVDGASAGIYDMGVIPRARRRGHARALTLAALAAARDAGCTGVTLNATGEGEPVYRAIGFESLGWGMTWWLFPGRRRPSG